MDTNTVKIYGLIDPETHAVRYIGQTLDVDRRLNEHINDALQDGDKRRWIKDLFHRGLHPVATVLAECTAENAAATEREWIARFGPMLLNENGMQLEAPRRQRPTTGDFPTLEQVEEHYIRTAMLRLGSCKIEVAKALGIGRQTLYNKLKRYQISV